MTEYDTLPPPGWFLLERDDEYGRAVIAQPMLRGDTLISVMRRRGRGDGSPWVFEQDAGVVLSADGLKSLLCMLVNLTIPAITATDHGGPDMGAVRRVRRADRGAGRRSAPYHQGAGRHALRASGPRRARRSIHRPAPRRAARVPMTDLDLAPLYYTGTGFVCECKRCGMRAARDRHGRALD